MITLQWKIMRGIYYAYILRLVSLSGVWQGFVMLGILILLTHFVSLGDVLHNITQIEMNHFGTFIYNAVQTTEAWTLFLVSIFVFILFSLRMSLIPQREDAYSFVQA